MGQFSGLIIAGIIFSSVIVGIGLWYGSLATNYGTSVPNYGFLNRSMQFQEKAIETRNATNVGSGQLQDLTSFNPIPAYNALQVAGGSLGILEGILIDISNPNQAIGFNLIPQWISIMIISILAVIIAVAVIYALLKVQL
jgi:hypothetical protein